MGLHIKAKPSLPKILQQVQFLNLLFHGTAQGIYPYIFLPKDIFENLTSSHPNPYHISLIIHEQTHLNRQKNAGWFRWIVSYIFLPRFRINEEMIANTAQMKYLKARNLPFPFEKKAQSLSSWIYLKPLSYKMALIKLKSLWSNI